MPPSLSAYWWSPRRSARALVSELRQHPRAWARVPRGEVTRFTNYGDELTALVLGMATGRPITWAPLGREQVVAIGSVLAPYLSRGGRGLIWGSGLHAPLTPAQRANVRLDRVLAVRGPMTREALGLERGTPLGDPGLLVRLMRPATTGRGRPLFVPHFTVFGHRYGREVVASFRGQGYEVADPSVRPAHMVDLVAAAPTVVTTGLHGAILAHALGVPAVLCSVSDDPRPQPGWKYRDFYASIGVPCRVAPWRRLVDAIPDDILEEATLAAAASSPRIDDMVERLTAAAKPLRDL